MTDFETFGREIIDLDKEREKLVAKRILADHLKALQKYGGGLDLHAANLWTKYVDNLVILLNGKYPTIE